MEVRSAKVKVSDSNVAAKSRSWPAESGNSSQLTTGYFVVTDFFNQAKALYGKAVRSFLSSGQKVDHAAWARLQNAWVLSSCLFSSVKLLVVYRTLSLLSYPCAHSMHCTAPDTLPCRTVRPTMYTVPTLPPSIVRSWLRTSFSRLFSPLLLPLARLNLLLPQ
jgi:hypothetical protein